jgi:superfamily II RNA helicase
MSLAEFLKSFGPVGKTDKNNQGPIIFASVSVQMTGRCWQVTCENLTKFRTSSLQSTFHNLLNAFLNLKRLYDESECQTMIDKLFVCKLPIEASPM